MADERVADGRLAALADRFEMGRRAFAAVLAVVALGLVARLLWLGARPMHLDEARVAYWGLRGARTGLWTYQPVVHGPLMQHFNRLVFPFMGGGDFPARLPVALVGGLLPAAALLFRERLRDVEVVALAALLAFNPLLLYYSRFMRSDLLVATFAVVCLGALVRLYDTRRPAYLYAAAASLALAFASKENAIVYVLCWFGMFGLVAGLEVLDPRRFESRAELWTWATDRVDWARDRVAGRGALGPLGHGIGALLVFAAVTVFMFARRAPPGEGVSLWHSSLVVVVQYVVGDVACGLEFWSPIHDIPVPHVLLPESLYGQTCLGFPSEEGPLDNYVSYMGRQLQIVGKTAVTVAALSLVGIATEFRRERPRVLVPAAFYWGVASLLGYPVGSDILFPAWVAVHSVVPLTIPAAAGAASIVDWARDAVETDDDVSAAAIGLAVLLLAGTTAGVAVHHSYVAPTGERWSTEDAQMVQYAQPEQPFAQAVDATRRASAEEEGLDVVVYGNTETYSLVDMGPPDEHAVGCMKFFRALPLSYYLYAYEADTTCADNGTRLGDLLEAEPPVVVSRTKSAHAVRQRIDDRYVEREYHLRQGGRDVTFFFDPDRVDVPPPNREQEAAGQSSVE